MMHSSERGSACFHPLVEGGVTPLVWRPGMSLAAIAREAAAPDWFFEHGVIRVNGRAYDRALWAHVKPKAGAFVDLGVTVQGGKMGRIMITLATIAVAVATAVYAPGLTESLIAAGWSATAATAATAAAMMAVGMATQLAATALTPAPSMSRDGQEQRELSQAGVTGNPMTRGEVMMGVLGRIRVSPQHIIPPYTTLEGDVLYSHMMVGVHGRCAISEIKINGMAIADIPEVTYETRQGTGSDSDTFLSDTTTRHRPAGVELSRHKLQDDRSYKDRLVDQVVPANSLPSWHPFRKKANERDIRFRFLFEGGIINSTGTKHSVPIRIDVKKKGDAVWRKLPTFHVQDLKGAGPFRREIRIAWIKPPGGCRIGSNKDVDVWGPFYKTAPGQSFEYTSDSYFAQNSYASVLPEMNAATTAGVTFSASSELSATYAAWKAADSVGGTFWRPAASSLPAWLKVDLGAPATIKSLLLAGDSNAPTASPSSLTVEGSNNNATWTQLADVGSIPDLVGGWVPVSFDTWGAYRYYKINIPANKGAANGDVRISNIYLSTEYGLGYCLSASSISFGSTSLAARNVSVDVTGATVWLDPDQWPDGEYDIRIKRGWAYATASLTTLDVLYDLQRYTYSGSYGLPHFFDYYTTSGEYAVYVGQKDIQSKTVIESVTCLDEARPILQSVEQSLARIALRVPNLRIDSLSAVFTSYAPLWTNIVGWEDHSFPLPDTPIYGDWHWSDEYEYATRNPAALYRQALLNAGKNVDTLPDGLVDSSNLEAFSEWCDAEGFTCDAIVHGRSVAEVLQLLASCGRASPKRSDKWAVAIDSDRSADGIEALITPNTSKDGGTRKIFAKVPHALRARYLDEENDYAEAEVTVYRSGYDSSTATLVEAISYDGIVTEAAAIARATYDLRQMLYRSIEYTRTVGIEGGAYTRGTLIGLADDVLQSHLHFGLVRAVLTSGGTVTGVVLHGVARLSDATGPFAAEIRKADGSVVNRAITETTDTDTVTFTTPITDDGNWGIDQPIAIGPVGIEKIRTILRHKTPAGADAWTLTLVPEAPEIFA